MNAHDDFIAKYTHHNAQLRKANLANKAIVFDALQSAGITSVWCIRESCPRIWTI